MVIQQIEKKKIIIIITSLSQIREAKSSCPPETNERNPSLAAKTPNPLASKCCARKAVTESYPGAQPPSF